MLQALAAAPTDDEPSSAAEDASAREALAAYDLGEAVSANDLRWELEILPRQALRRMTAEESATSCASTDRTCSRPKTRVDRASVADCAERPASPMSDSPGLSLRLDRLFIGLRRSERQR